MIAGHEITPFGFSVVPFLIVGGLVVLGLFTMWEERRARTGADVLLNRSMLKVPTLRAGASTLLMQQLILMGTFFILPVYLQVVLGYDAFETGKRLFPLSIALLLAALAGPRLAVRLAPRLVVQVGLAAMVVAAFALVGTIGVALNGGAFALALVFFGLGAGLLMSQLGNVIMSSVPQSEANEAGGLQGSAQNLGASLGTALIGSVLLLSLTNGFVSRIAKNPDISQATQTTIAQNASKGIPIVTLDEVNQAAVDAGSSSKEAAAITSAYSEAELNGLKVALLTVAFFAVLALWFTRRLPGRAREPAGDP